MAGETIIARVRDQAQPTPGKAFVGWALSAPVVGPDGVAYQTGSDLISFSPLGDAQATQKSLRDGIAARVSAITGQAFTAADVRGFQAVRTGTVAVSLLQFTKDIVFSIPMPSDKYRVMYQATGGLSVGLGTTNKTATGFTLTLSASVAGDVDYLAVED